MRKSLRLDREEPKEREERIPTFWWTLPLPTDGGVPLREIMEEVEQKLAKGKAPDAVDLVEASWTFSLERTEEAVIGRTFSVTSQVRFPVA